MRPTSPVGGGSPTTPWAQRGKAAEGRRVRSPERREAEEGKGTDRKVTRYGGCTRGPEASVLTRGPATRPDVEGGARGRRGRDVRDRPVRPPLAPVGRGPQGPRTSTPDTGLPPVSLGPTPTPCRSRPFTRSKVRPRAQLDGARSPPGRGGEGFWEAPVS